MKRKLLLLLLMVFIATSYSYGQYCSASGGGDEYISGVEIGSISNTGTGADGYHDYTALSTDLYQGQSGASITITNGASYGSDDVGVWIDWNQDSDFDDADENVVCDADGGGQGTFTFDVPAGATLGNTVMRVRIKYFDSDCGSPCSTTSYGEVEDYTINITNPPSCPAPTAQTESNITASSADLGWTESGTATTWNIEYGPLGFAQGSGTQVTGVTKPYTLSGLTAATSYDWYVQADCGSSGSTWTGPSTFSTECPAKVTTFPYTTDFENGGLIANCWTNDPSDAGGDWEFVTTNSHGATADHTTGSGYYALLNDYSVTTSNSPFNLLTPVFDLSTIDKWYKVSYWTWIGSDGATNPIAFEVSLDGGSTWKTLYTHDHSTTETWFKTEIELGFNKSDNVQFRFIGTSIWGYNTDNSGIDDFTIEETQAPPVPLSDWAIYAGVFFILSFLVIRFKRRLA